MKNLFIRFLFWLDQNRLFKKKTGRGKPLRVLDDIVFKKMLTQNNEHSREALRLLVSACTHREVSVVKVKNSEILPVFLGAKSQRLDVFVTFNDGEVADLEMQMRGSSEDLKKRAAYSACRLVVSQVEKGRKYKNIKRAYQIFFLDCVVFKESEKLPRRYSYREEKEDDQLTEMVEIILYEMPKLEQRLNDFLAGNTGIEALPEEEKWCMFMKYRYDKRAKPLIEELCRKEEGIMHAEKALSRIRFNFKQFWAYTNEILNEWEREDRIECLKKETLEKGLEEGREKGHAEVLELLAQGLSLEEIKQRLKEPHN